MKVLKETTSISPLSGKEIEAKIIKEDNKVYMLKCDEQGRQYKSSIEDDFNFYQALTGNMIRVQMSPISCLLYISSKCNLNCPVCYEALPENSSCEPSLNQIMMIIKKYVRKRYIPITLCGREPTCREDLPEIIRNIAKKKHVYLLTNGIKLSDYNYLLELKKNGLRDITFSLNGFDDEVYERMNGRPLLTLKLKALENIKRLEISTIISMTLARGINENQIKNIYDYCLRNRDFVRQLRIRSLAPLGKYLKIKPYCMSEMLSVFAKSLDICKQDILKEVMFMDRLSKNFRIDLLHSRLCWLNFHLKNREVPTALGEKIKEEWIRKAKSNIFLSIYYLVRFMGITTLIKGLSVFFKFPLFPYRKDRKTIRIALRCWPSIYNLDLNENKKCTTVYYKNKKLYPFCYYNIIDSQKNKLSIC
jgi:uncharacterized radical SAM superfamily Fe-S cluster-containing enzyme